MAFNYIFAASSKINDYPMSLFHVCTSFVGKQRIFVIIIFNRDKDRYNVNDTNSQLAN